MRDPSPYAGQTVKLRSDAAELGGHEAEVIDWYERTGQHVSWRDNPTDPRTENYRIRRGLGQLPDDDEVLFARVDGMGQLIHVSEIDGASVAAMQTTRGPKPPHEKAVGKPCPACLVPLKPADLVAAIPLGPGASKAARGNARAGLPYEAVMVEIHWPCHTGDDSYTRAEG